jgi:lyso-ornithine lipid O-acyltransferase
MTRLCAAIKISIFLTVTFALMPLQFVILRLSPRHGGWLPFAYHRFLTRLLGIRVSVEGQKPQVGPVLIVANHVSWLDIVALSSTMPLSFIAKREVAGWPLFGLMAKLQRTVFVNRDRRTSTGNHRDDIAMRLKSGDTLVLFPEGTSGDGLSVLPFKSAFFGAAENSRAAILPVTLAYLNWHGLPVGRRDRPSFAWYGDMTLPQHLWEFLQKGPVHITIKLHELTYLDFSGGRKVASRSIHRLIQDSLAQLSHGR